MYRYCILAQRRREFYSTATSRFFTYRGGIWNALTAINEGLLYHGKAAPEECLPALNPVTYNTDNAAFLS